MATARVKVLEVAGSSSLGTRPGALPVHNPGLDFDVEGFTLDEREARVRERLAAWKREVRVLSCTPDGFLAVIFGP